MYILAASKRFKEQFQRYISQDKKLKNKLFKTLEFLEHDPFYPSLKSHKVFSKRHGMKWASWVTGDVRIIWNFNEEQIQVLDLLDLGKHSGSDQVYK